jgi:hypothetical protein
MNSLAEAKVVQSGSEKVLYMLMKFPNQQLIGKNNLSPWLAQGSETLMHRMEEESC